MTERKMLVKDRPEGLGESELQLWGARFALDNICDVEINEKNSHSKVTTYVRLDRAVDFYSRPLVENRIRAMAGKLTSNDTSIQSEARQKLEEELKYLNIALSVARSQDIKPNTL